MDFTIHDLFLFDCISLFAQAGSWGLTPAERAERDRLVREIFHPPNRKLLDALHSYSDNLDKVREVLSEGADPNVRNSVYNKETPLHMAMLRKPKPEVV